MFLSLLGLLRRPDRRQKTDVICTMPGTRVAYLAPVKASIYFDGNVGDGMG